MFCKGMNTCHCHEYIFYLEMGMSTKSNFLKKTKVGPKNKCLGGILEQELAYSW